MGVVSPLIRLATRLNEYEPTADHDYRRALDDKGMALAIRELWSGYEGATEIEKRAIEHATKGFFEHPTEYVDKAVAAEVTEWSAKLPMIRKAYALAGNEHAFKRVIGPYIKG